MPPEQAWDAVRTGRASLLDLRSRLERRRFGSPPQARRVSLLRHALWPRTDGAVYLCQHAVRSKLTLWRGAREVEGGFVAWQRAGLPVE